MSEEIDLSDVDPLKWAEVRKRVKVVRDYLAIPHATSVDRDRHAAMLGLQAGQFYNLVRAWRTYRRPSALTTGIRDVARPSRSRRGGVDPRARAIARNVIAELGRAAPLNRLVVRTRELCAAEDVAPPSRGTIYGLTREAGTFATTSEICGILVARAFMRLPTIIDGQISFPKAIMVAEMPKGRLLDASLVHDARDSTMHHLVSTIRSRLEKADLPITAADCDVDILEAAFPTATFVRESMPNVARALASTVGRRIGHIEFRTRQPTASVNTIMQSGRDAALSWQDAEMALQIARAHHNEAIDATG